MTKEINVQVIITFFSFVIKESSVKEKIIDFHFKLFRSPLRDSSLLDTVWFN